MSCVLPKDLMGQVRDQQREQQRVVGFPYGLEESVFVRTTHHHYVGVVQGTEEGFLILSPAAWVLYSGSPSVHIGCVMRSNFSLTDLLDQDYVNSNVRFQPFPEEVRVALGHVLDTFPWRQSIPRNEMG